MTLRFSSILMPSVPQLSPPEGAGTPTGCVSALMLYAPSPAPGPTVPGVGSSQDPARCLTWLQGLQVCWQPQSNLAAWAGFCQAERRRTLAIQTARPEKAVQAADIWVLCCCRCNLHLRTPSELFSVPVQEDAQRQPSCCDLKTTSICLPWPCTPSSTSVVLLCLLHPQICPGIHWHRPWSSAYLRKDESSLYKR